MNKTIFLVGLFFSLIFITTSHQVFATEPIRPVLSTDGLSPKVGIKGVAPTTTRKSSTETSNKQKQLVDFKSVEIKRIYSGKWVWKAILKRAGTRYVPANTARLTVTQKLSNGKTIVLVNENYKKDIKNTGLMEKVFVPSSDGDTLNFILEEKQVTDQGLPSAASRIVERRVVKMPVEKVTLTRAGYSYTASSANNPYLYASFKNEMSWPIRIRLRMMGGDYSHWTTERFNREIALPVGTFEQKEYWEHTAKDDGWWMVVMEKEYLNPETMEIYWKEVDRKKGILGPN